MILDQECLRIVGFNFIRMKTHDQLFDKYYLFYKTHSRPFYIRSRRILTDFDHVL